MSETETRERCGYAVTDDEGIEQPCDRPATGWRWYQDCVHQDCLEAACDIHANYGGDRMHAAEADLAAARAEVAALRSAVEDWMHDAGLFNVNSFGDVVIDPDDVELLSEILRGEDR